MAALLAGNVNAQEKTMATNDVAKSTTVIMTTSEGDVEIELFGDKAPISVSNFLAYVDSNFYDNTIYHRVIPNFMIQGGGFEASMRQKATRPPIKNEAANGLKNDRGTLAMARTSVIDSATSQFFINVVNNDFLNHGGRDFGYAVFGKVTAGMEVVDKIAAGKTGSGDVPVKTVLIKSVKRK
jgi:peptidyl-prolyl cis-trans isomerase A (cyclophilin A)